MADKLGVRGLTAHEVERRRAEFGANVLTPPPRDPWWQLFLGKFNDPVIRILMIAAGLAIGIGAMEGEVAAEGIGILVAIVLATFLSFWNEYRANKEFDILNKTNDDVLVKVIRDGTYVTLSRREIVVGDYVLVEVGEEVPADGDLREAMSLLVNESRLTGETKPAKKHLADGENAYRTAYGPSVLLRGTTVVDGYGLYEVTAVGDRSEIGKTLRESIEENLDPSPLNRQLAGLSRVIGVVGFTVAVITFLALIIRGISRGDLELSPEQWSIATIFALGMIVGLSRVWLPIVFDGLQLSGLAVQPPAWLQKSSVIGWLKTLALGGALAALGMMALIATGSATSTPTTWLPTRAIEVLLRDFMIAVTIIVVAVPEGLAMSVTLSLAYSMRKMTASNNLVRRMDACETIGAATVICSDKTGTLTLNEMRVVDAVFPSATATDLPSDDQTRQLVIEAIAANTTAHLSREPGQPVAGVGNPTECALLLWLEGLGVDYIVPRKAFTITSQWTFTTDRKFMATLGHSPVLGPETLHLKGAPEILQQRCSHRHTTSGSRPLSETDRHELEEVIRQFQARGMRTLGFAYQTHPRGEFTAEGLAHDLIWLGLVAIADPIRPEVPDAVAACRTAGVGVKMITGDSPATAREIARQTGLWDDHDPAEAILIGSEFAALPDDRATQTVKSLKVLARARPVDKLRLVKLLKEQGEVVAVTGDGVNDGPALNSADVGLAMGKTGTAVAKEASDIILLDDSFTSIINAIRWGRALYENIQRFILFQLTINVAALGIALLGPFIGFELPLTVMQMLWVNLIMDTFAALALATEPPHDEVLQRPPRRADAFIVTREMTVTILSVAALFLVVLISLIVAMTQRGLLTSVTEPSWGGTILFTVFVFLQFWNLFNAKCLGRNDSVFPTLWNNRSFLAVAALILAGQFFIVQYGGEVFRTVPLSWREWLILFASTSVVLWVGELLRLRQRLRLNKA